MNHRFRRITIAVLTLFLCSGTASFATEYEEETSLTSAPGSPYVYVSAPATGQSYESGNRLTVKAEGQNVKRITLELRLADQTLTYEAEGSLVEYTFEIGTPQTQGATLTVRGYAETSKDPSVSTAEQTVEVLSPKAELIEKMIALAYANSKDSRYMFAPRRNRYRYRRM